MKITSSDTIEDINKEIEQVVETVPEIEFTGAIVGDDKPIADNDAKEESDTQQDKDHGGAMGRQDNSHDPIVKEVPPLTHADLLKALDMAEDIYDRAGVTMIVLSDNAKGMQDRDNVFEYTDDLHVAIRNNDYHGYNKMVFDTYLPSYAEWFDDDGFIHVLTPEGVNIYFEFVDNKKYPFFDMPDKKQYIRREVALPNPFKEYYKVMCEGGEE